MKQLTLLLLLICTGTAVFSQSSKRCWNFETQCPHPENSFYTLCINDAHSASGSPDTKSDYAGITAYEGSKYAHMYARYCPEGLSRNHGEGIILKYDFTAGKSYTLKFAYRSPLPPSETKILLATNMPNFGGIPPNGGGCTDNLDILPAITAGNTLIGTITPGANWQVATLTFTPNANFNQIWIRPQQNGSDAQGVLTSDLYVDDICVKESCDPDKYTVALCQNSLTSLVATINGVSVPQGQWRLWHAKNCNGSVNTNNLGAQVPINWISSNSFGLTDNSGCYVLAYIFQQPGCGAVELVRVFINTDLDNIPHCDRWCGFWHISVAEDYCEVVYFYAVSDYDQFPAGTVVTATIDGHPVGFDLPNLIRYFPYSGESHLIQVCFTVQEPGCPEPTTQCYDYYVDCAEIIGDPKDTDRSAEHTDIVKKGLSVTNPSTGLIRFSRTVEHGIAQLYTVQGALIQSTVLDQADQLDVNTVSAGQYILAIQESTGVTTRLVFINNR